MDRKFVHLGLALSIALTFAALATAPFSDYASEFDIDLHHALNQVMPWRPNDPKPSPAVVVALDEATYASPPFAGIPRVMWTPQLASVQDAILVGGARVVGWDLVLPTSAATYVADRNFDRPLLRSLNEGKRGNRIVLGMSEIGQTKIQPHRLFLFTAGGVKNLRSLNVTAAHDGVVRSIPTFVNTKRSDGSFHHVPTMAVELASRWRGERPVRSDDGGLKIGESLIGGVKDDRIVLNFATSTSRIPTYSFADLWQCAEAENANFFRENFDGKVVLFGLVLDVEDRKLSSNRFVTDGRPPGPTVKCTDTTQESATTAPRRATTPGVYLIATAVNNVVRGEPLVELSRSDRALLVLPLAIAAAIVTLYFGPLSAGLICMAAMTGWLGLASYSFAHSHVLPLVLPILACALTFVGVLGFRFVFLERQGRFLRRAFGSYVAPELVDDLVRNPDRLRLSGERRDMSFLFSDLAGFTTLVEGTDPTTIVSTLNAYLDQLIEIAKRNGGTIDKVIGDAVVIIFSAPLERANHAEQAVFCAIEMDAAASEFARVQRASGVAFGDTRIGVHSGSAVVGNIGGSGFFDYTVIGDAMNTAARLESANKQLGTRVAISGETTGRIPGFQGRPAGRLVLKGKTEPVAVYQPLSAKQAVSAFQKRYIAAYEMLDDDAHQANRMFAELHTEFPDDPLVALHHRRLTQGESGSIVVLSEK